MLKKVTYLKEYNPYYANECPISTKILKFSFVPVQQCLWTVSHSFVAKLLFWLVFLTLCCCIYICFNKMFVNYQKKLPTFLDLTYMLIWSSLSSYQTKDEKRKINWKHETDLFPFLFNCQIELCLTKFNGSVKSCSAQLHLVFPKVAPRWILEQHGKA